MEGKEGGPSSFLPPSTDQLDDHSESVLVRQCHIRNEIQS